MLDGEGGYTVWGKLLPAARSRVLEAVPIGLAHGIKLKRDVDRGAVLTSADVVWDEANPALAVRREMQLAKGLDK